MPTQIPDPATWRPSDREWRPRLYVGEHWQDKSIPVYCYFVEPKEGEKAGPNSNLTIKWAIWKLGTPFRGKPSWLSFEAPIANMSGGQLVNSTWTLDLQRKFGNYTGSILEQEYLAQDKFEDNSPVYREEELLEHLSSKALELSADVIKQKRRESDKMSETKVQSNGTVQTSGQTLHAGATSTNATPQLVRPETPQLSGISKTVEDETRANIVKELQNGPGATPTKKATQPVTSTLTNSERSNSQSKASDITPVRKEEGTRKDRTATQEPFNSSSRVSTSQRRHQTSPIPLRASVIMTGSSKRKYPEDDDLILMDARISQKQMPSAAYEKYKREVKSLKHKKDDAASTYLPRIARYPPC